MNSDFVIIKNDCMKLLKLSLLSSVFMLIAQLGLAQTKTETFKVSGVCGSCKKKIETAAKDAGADYAVWNKNSKMLVVKYNSTSTNQAKIQQAIAGSGYDTPNYKASEDAYNNLDDCCKYDRSTVGKKGGCSDEEGCSKKDKHHKASAAKKA
jgi:hypothetical protein